MIEMVGLTKRFEGLTAVDDVTLSVRPGEVLALLGPNGAGKTTTVRMLSSILKPTRGRAQVAGYDVVTQGADVRRRVGVLTEAPGLYTRMTGQEYLDFFGQVRGLSRLEREGRIAELAEQFKLTDALPRRLGEYSKGMRQKIALVRTMMHNPPVLLLDEPTSAMDPESARLVRDAILKLRDDAQRSIMICTHNLPEAEELSDRIAIIRHGRILAQGTFDVLKASLLGPPVMELRYLSSNGSGHGNGNGNGNGAVSVVSRFADVDAYGDAWVRFQTPDPAATNPALLKSLAEAGVSVVTLSEVPRSLEKVYLRVVGDGGGRDVYA
jgi:ABC-2 type transport system ATP-binding protein